MKILIHIGQSKTGSSAIQSFLTKNRHILSESGDLYPMPQRNGLATEVASHNALADSLLGVSRYPHLRKEEYFEQFFQQARATGARRIILSGEHFWGGEPRMWNTANENDYWGRYSEKVGALGKRLRGHEVEILLYLRPQVDWFASTIGHDICFLQSSIMETSPRSWAIDGHYSTDREYFLRSRHILQYSRKLDIWRDNLSPYSVVVVPYIRSDLRDGSSVSDFLFRSGLLGLSLADTESQPDVNVSISREYIEVKKILNQTPKSLAEEKTVVEVLRSLSSNSAVRGGYRLDYGLCEEIEGYVAEDNMRLSDIYLGGAKFGARDIYSESLRAPIAAWQVNEAMERFLVEHKRFAYRLRELRHGSAYLMRSRLSLLHAAVQQLKRLAR